MEPQFWIWELDEQNHHDAEHWLHNDQMVGVVDEQEGGIILYVHRLHSERIVKLLNGGGEIAVV